MTSREHGFWHKLREIALEIALEIAIIVFAVSLSIWLHSVGEHRHEQAQVKTFLLGLKRDIQADLAQVNDIVAFHKAADGRYAYLASLDPAAAPDAALFNAAYNRLNENNFLVPRLGRYEGFKSSGKLTNIENDALLEKIVNHYQYDLPKVNMSSGGWMSNHGKLTTYAEQQTGEDDSLASRYRMIASPKGKRLSERMVTHAQIYQRFATVVIGGNAIIKEIDLAYPEQR